MSRQAKTSKGFLTPIFILLVSITFLVPVETPSSAQADRCPGNLLKNGDFATGVVVAGGGNFPPSTVPSWASAFNTPQVSAGQGCGNPGFVSMWGNKTVGEAIRQTGVPIQAGRKYRVSACVRWPNNNPALPNYVRFNVRASSGSLANYPTGANFNEAQIGVSPNITSTLWATVTLPDWTAPSAYDTITINPENDNTANDGGTVSWIQLDNVCIQEVSTPPDFKSTNVCLGQPTSFNGLSPGATSWNWDFGDGSTNNTQQNPTHTYANAGTYNVKLCVNGTTNCVTHQVTVNPKPPVPVITGPSSSCGAQTATYSVPATPGVSYSWNVSNGVINGPPTGNSVSVTWNPGGGGTISVTVTNKAGCSSSARMAVGGCNLFLGECCREFQSKTDLKSFVHAGSGVYNFTPTLSVSAPNIVRVTANVVSSSLTYSSPSCGAAGPVNSYVTGAQNAGGFAASIPVTNGHEVIWHGAPANVSGLDFPMQIKFPPPPTGACRDELTFCVKYTFTDRNCKTCEVIRCYGPFRRGGRITDFGDIKDTKDIKLRTTP